jgi:hypothetical protein
MFHATSRSPTRASAEDMLTQANGAPSPGAREPRDPSLAKVSLRRIRFAMASACPYAREWLRRRRVDFDPPYREATSARWRAEAEESYRGEGVDRDREGAGREQPARIDWRREE